MGVYSRPAGALDGLTPAGIAAQTERDRQLEQRLIQLEEILAAPPAPPEPPVGVEGFASAVVSTTSTVYVGLSGGPSVTVTLGPAGQALVCVSGGIDNSTTVDSSYMSWDATGLSAADSRAIRWQSAGLGAFGRSALYNGTPGASVTFTAKYRAAGGQASYSDRRLTVVTW